MCWGDLKHGSDLVRFALGVGVGWGQGGDASRSWEERGWGTGVSGSEERSGALIRTRRQEGRVAVP